MDRESSEHAIVAVSQIGFKLLILRVRHLGNSFLFNVWLL
jgi:hypothetical protein